MYISILSSAVELALFHMMKDTIQHGAQDH